MYDYRIKVFFLKFKKGVKMISFRKLFLLSLLFSFLITLSTFAVDQKSVIKEMKSLYKQKKINEAIAFGVKNLSALEKSGGNNKEISSLSVMIAEMYKKQNNFEQAEHLLFKAKNLLEDKDLNDSGLFKIYRSLGSLYNIQGYLKQSELFYNKALALAKSKWGLYNKKTFTIWNLMGGMYAKYGNYEDAEKSYNSAIDIGQKEFGKTSTHMAVLYYNLGDILLKKNDLKNAEKSFLDSLNIMNQDAAAHYNELSLIYDKLAFINKSKNNVAKAEDFYRKSIQTKKQIKGNELGVANSTNNLAVLYMTQGEYKESYKLFISALSLCKKRLADNDPIIINLKRNIKDCKQMIDKKK